LLRRPVEGFLFPEVFGAGEDVGDGEEVVDPVALCRMLDGHLSANIWEKVAYNNSTTGISHIVPPKSE
jgi:hypothetical protein